MNIITARARHALPSHAPELFGWALPSSSNRSSLHAVARRISDRTGVPFGVVLAHAEQAGLGREAL